MQNILWYIHTKFGSYWSCSFRGEEFWKIVNDDNGCQQTPSNGKTSHGLKKKKLRFIMTWVQFHTSSQIEVFLKSFLNLNFNQSDHWKLKTWGKTQHKEILNMRFFNETQAWPHTIHYLHYSQRSLISNGKLDKCFPCQKSFQLSKFPLNPL